MVDVAEPEVGGRHLRHSSDEVLARLSADPRTPDDFKAAAASEMRIRETARARRPDVRVPDLATSGTD